MNLLTVRQPRSSLPRLALSLFLICLFGVTDAYAHGVAEGDQGYVQEVSGVQFLPFML